jgi:hypothetical protein
MPHISCACLSPWSQVLSSCLQKAASTCFKISSQYLFPSRTAVLPSASAVTRLVQPYIPYRLRASRGPLAPDVLILLRSVLWQCGNSSSTLVARGVERFLNHLLCDTEHHNILTQRNLQNIGSAYIGLLTSVKGQRVYEISNHNMRTGFVTCKLTGKVQVNDRKWL